MKTRGFIVVSIVCCTGMILADSAEMVGRWDVEVRFDDGAQRRFQLEAQSDGRATLELMDPRARTWGAPTSFAAKWSKDEGNAVTFSAPVEFLIGNVGRDAGILTFKGKFETSDVISGEIDFSPAVGERPSRHGVFEATRAK
jgi:hypothetical protein